MYRLNYEKKKKNNIALIEMKLNEEPLIGVK